MHRWGNRSGHTNELPCQESCTRLGFCRHEGSCKYDICLTMHSAELLLHDGGALCREVLSCCLHR